LVESVRLLVNFVEFENSLCHDPELFVHNLNCIDALGISFCYWDAFRLHRQYASKGFRGLLNVVKKSISYEGDTYSLAMKMFNSNKRKKAVHTLDTLVHLDKLSSVLIELYPDLGFDSNFVDFVDSLIIDDFLSVLSQTNLAEEKGLITKSRPPAKSNPTEMVLSHDVKNPSVQAILKSRSALVKQLANEMKRSNSLEDWLLDSKICPDYIDIESATATFATSDGDFDSFLCFLSWLSEHGMNMSNHQALSSFLKYVENPRPPSSYLLRVFEIGCRDKRHSWVPADWYGFAYEYASSIPWFELRSMVHNSNYVIDFPTFSKFIEKLESSHDIKFRLDPLSTSLYLPFTPIDIDLLYRIVANDKTTHAEFQQSVESYLSDQVKNKKIQLEKEELRVNRIARHYGVLEAVVCVPRDVWMSLVCSFFRPFLHLLGSVTLASTLYVYEEFAPLLGVEAMVEALLYLARAHKESVLMDMFVLFKMDDHSDWFGPHVFQCAAMSQPQVVAQVEAGMSSCGSMELLRCLDSNLVRLYNEIASPLESLYQPAVVESVFRLAIERQIKPQVLVFNLFSKPLYLSRHRIYDIMFDPLMVEFLENIRKGCHDLFMDLAEKSLLSKNGFLKCADVLNLSIGSSESETHNLFVKLLGQKVILEQIYESSIDSRDSMTFEQFLESIGRIAIAICEQISDNKAMLLPAVTTGLQKLFIIKTLTQ